MSLSKVNALAIKGRRSNLIQWTKRQRWYKSKSWLSDKIKGFQTYGPLKVSSLWHIIDKMSPIRLLSYLTLLWTFFVLFFLWTDPILFPSFLHNLLSFLHKLMVTIGKKSKPNLGKIPKHKSPNYKTFLNFKIRVAFVFIHIYILEGFFVKNICPVPRVKSQKSTFK